MRARRGVLVGLMFALALSAPAGAAPLPPNAVKSQNVDYLTSIEEPNVISARFKGNFMFVSHSRGLTVYDIANPANPQRAGFLPLPHFENEDVDLGGNILLVSNDPNEGKGALYVIDISDPRQPKPIGLLDTGIIDSGIDVIGGVFGIDTPNPYGTGHTASCVQECRFAYLAGTRRGIDIVDLRDPSNPKYANPKSFAAPEVTGFTTHDVQFDRSGRALITGADGTAGYDIADPLHPKLAFRTDASARSRYGLEPTDGKSVNDFVHHNSARTPEQSLTFSPAGPKSSGDSSVMMITEEDYTRPGCAGAGTFQTWGIGADNVMRNLDQWEVELDPEKQGLCSAHYFDERLGLVAQGWYEQGTRFLRITDPRNVEQVAYWIPRKNVTWGALFPPNDPTGQIVYALDNARGIDVLRINRAAPAAAGPPPRQENFGPGPGGTPVGRPSGATRVPNVRVELINGHGRLHRGQRFRYALTVRNTSRLPVRGVTARLALPRSVTFLRRGRPSRQRRFTYNLGRMPGSSRRVFRLPVRVASRPAGRHIQASASLRAAQDRNRIDNFTADRDRIVPARRRRASSSGRPARAEASSLAREVVLATSRMAPVVAPVLSRESQTRAAAERFGALCRIVLS